MLNLGMLGLRVIKLFAVYVIDGWTDKTKTYWPLPYVRGIIIIIV